MTTKLDYVVSTGDYIVEWMDSEGINAAELSRRLGVTRKHVSELLSGKAPLSHHMALALERVTGVPARVWNMSEAGYRDALARRDAEAALANQYPQAQEFPLTYLRRFGVISAPARDRGATVSQLLSLFGVASLDAFWSTWEEGSVAYRRSAVHRPDAPKLATWLALAEHHRDGVGDVPDYDRGRLEAALPTLRRLTVGDPLPSIKRATQILLDAGVVLCLVPPVPGLGIHGATRWLHGTPVIQLSLLGKTDDPWWFTLFHELGHVLLHGEGSLYLYGEDSDAEAEADAFAADTLIPSEYHDRLPRSRNISAIERLAAELEVAPSIVLGRTQRFTGDYAWGHGLKRKVEWVPS